MGNFVIIIIILFFNVFTHNITNDNGTRTLYSTRFFFRRKNKKIIVLNEHNLFIY